MHEHIQILTTVATKQEGEELALALLKKRLAACVQLLGPMTSFYWWQGKITRSEEWLCVAKTRASLYKQAEEVIRAAHSYEVPEIIAVPILYGSEGYLRWLATEVKEL